MSFMPIDQDLSLMIPRVFPQWVDEQTIVDIFHKQHLGLVYKVSIVRQPDSKRRSYPVYQAFIYFSAWYENEIAYNFQQRIFGPKKQARIVYDDPWFWVAFENNRRRLSNNDKRIMRLGNISIKTLQKLDRLDETLTECENIMREIKETSEKQKRMFAEFKREAEPEVRKPLPLAIQQCISSFLDEEYVDEDHVHEFAAHNLSVQECIDEILASEQAEQQQEQAEQQEQSEQQQQATVENRPHEYERSRIQRQNPGGQQAAHLNWNHRNLEATANALLGDDLALTETAMNVAERALDEWF